MDLPDCPPGTEGYEDTVTEIPKKLGLEGTKAEQEFLEHLGTLKIKLEDGSARPMLERKGRDGCGKWIYLCFPCAAQCSGEQVLQLHIAGKRHKMKLAQKNEWPVSIFHEHPYILNEKGAVIRSVSEALKTLKDDEKPTETLDPLEQKYGHYRSLRCHIQEILDDTKAPLIGVEYLVEHPPEESHHEPQYICTLCYKQGHPRTIVNHLTCYSHRIHYLSKHFPKAHKALLPYRNQKCSRTGQMMVMNRLVQCIEMKYGRMKPVNFQKDEFQRNKDEIERWIYAGKHFSEADGCTFEEVIDADLISNLASLESKEPSPPTVAAPSKPKIKIKPIGLPTEQLSDISDDEEFRRNDIKRNVQQAPPEQYYTKKHLDTNSHVLTKERRQRPGNLEFKVKRAKELSLEAETTAKRMLAYHEKNPEKHPLYPEEWKKFWNRRYKELQAEGKDTSKHDFKPEWIKFWTVRMKELHDQELRVAVHEIYRKFSLAIPNNIPSKSEDRRRRSVEKKRSLSPQNRRSSPEFKKIVRQHSPERRISLDRKRSLERRRSPDTRRSSERRRSPDRRRSQERRRSPDRLRRFMERRPFKDTKYKIDRRPIVAVSELRANERSVSPPPRRSPLRLLRTRSRSPIKRSLHKRSRSPSRSTWHSRGSPLSQRGDLTTASSAARNPSPTPTNVEPSMQTVLISDDELQGGTSPWDSGDSLGSLPDMRSPPSRSRGDSLSSRISHARHTSQDYKSLTDSADNIVATLRMLVALEDHLGSMGPKVVDLLAEAIRMEKEKANSSEELLDRETAVVLIETAKEKLKGGLQAGLVPAAATSAVRAAVVRAAATLHAADKRTRARQKQERNKPTSSKASIVPVAGVGEVDREEIAQQMAAALIAQGKTDVSSEELAQLVDAVVGMAEAKKREAKLKEHVKTIEHKRMEGSDSAAASALQMLQSAYDDNKASANDLPDAMDGLSDSDLETLLKNFNELSAEEQHSLIAYLKKLEAREPARVERLRQYVSADAEAAAVSESVPMKQPEKVDVKPVAIDSDDDDYTVDELFHSATQKVKEDQMRQEMEIVKKSLENKTPPKAESPKAAPPLFDFAKNISSASDLLALVQASIKSSSTAPAQVADVTPTTSFQPRSFGDLQENVEQRNSQPDFPNQISSFGTPSFNSECNFRDPYNSGNQQNPYQTPNVYNQSQNFNVPLGNQNNFNLEPNNVQYGQNNYEPRGNFNHQGPRHFTNGGKQHNHNFRPRGPQHGNRPQFGNFEQNNFKGRGRGSRGRGRGYY
ncbi:unnamed protein product [Pieris macdunnoughi]|uniref:Uncharacterized protein n=1 Tax=Pieris macdunnoughi TaxID=345717 RepID=A0A821QUP7_9NEOP|nr:unnamed protein product [Pieris macdunnoughi]